MTVKINIRVIGNNMQCDRWGKLPKMSRRSIFIGIIALKMEHVRLKVDTRIKFEKRELSSVEGLRMA